MNTTLAAALLVVIGEASVIYCEMISAKLFETSGKPFWAVFLKIFLVMTLGAWILMSGYMLGLRAFKNIWIVSVISLSSVLLLDPAMSLLVVKQLPTRGALIGFVLGALGLLAAIFL